MKLNIVLQQSMRFLRKFSPTLKSKGIVYAIDKTTSFHCTYSSLKSSVLNFVFIFGLVY